MMTSTTVDKYGLILFYLRQLRKFDDLGIGESTENRVIITPILLSATNRRLKQLKVMKGDLKYGIRHQHNANANS